MKKIPNARSILIKVLLEQRLFNLQYFISFFSAACAQIDNISNSLVHKVLTYR